MMRGLQTITPPIQPHVFETKQVIRPAQNQGIGK